MGKTVQELESTMTQQEYSEWQDYYNIEPFLADRIELQLATASFLTSTANGGKSNFKDFLVSHKQPKTTQARKGFVQSLL